MGDSVSEWLRSMTRTGSTLLLSKHSIIWVRPHRFKSCRCRVFHFFLAFDSFAISKGK
jgi:hypothetical protein